MRASVRADFARTKGSIAQIARLKAVGRERAIIHIHRDRFKARRPISRGEEQRAGRQTQPARRPGAQPPILAERGAHARRIRAIVRRAIRPHVINFMLLDPARSVPPGSQPSWKRGVWA